MHLEDQEKFVKRITGSGFETDSSYVAAVKFQTQTIVLNVEVDFNGWMGLS